jgi:hypothetical protein
MQSERQWPQGHRWARHLTDSASRPRGERGTPPNKRMQLTKLRAAPVWQAEVPPCAPAGRMDGGAASQLIRSVLRACAGSEPRPRLYNRDGR